SMGGLAAELITDAQRRGEDREGPLEAIAIPIFSTLNGFARLAVSVTLPSATLDRDLEHVIAHTLRGCAPDSPAPR
ncbi:TetR family transcriptional regulator, partial [Streptomyces sp. NPDC127044]